MTRVDAGLLLNDLLVLVVGYSALYAARLAALRPGDVRVLGLGYLLGWSLIGSVLSLLLVVGIGPSVPAFVAVSAVLGAAAVAVGRRRRAEPDVVRPPRSRHPLAIAAVVAGAAVLAIASFSALALASKGIVAYTDFWDALDFWIPKAQTIYYTGGLDPGLWGSLTHPEYPPLLPTMNAATFHFVGGFHPSVLTLQSALLGVAFLLAALTLLDRFTPRWISLPSLALLATTPWFWWRLQSALADQTLAYLITAGALLLVLWLYDGRLTWVALAGAFLVAATLTKLEGAMLEVLLLVVFLPLGLLRHRRAALPAAWLLLAPAAIVPWRLWLARNDLPTSAIDYHVSDLFDPGYLADRTDRLRTTLSWMLDTPFYELQTAVLVCAAIAVLVVVALRIPLIAAGVALWLALSCFGLAAIYWIGRLELHFYLSSSIGRVGTTIIVAATVLAPLLLGLALQPRGEPAEDS